MEKNNALELVEIAKSELDEIAGGLLKGSAELTSTATKTKGLFVLKEASLMIDNDDFRQGCIR